MKKLGILVTVMALLASLILPTASFAGASSSDAAAYLTVGCAGISGNGPYQVSFKVLSVDRWAIFYSKLTPTQKTLVLREINKIQTVPVSEYHAPFIFKPGKIARGAISVQGNSVIFKLVW